MTTEAEDRGRGDCSSGGEQIPANEFYDISSYSIVRRGASAAFARGPGTRLFFLDSVLRKRLDPTSGGAVDMKEESASAS